MTTVPGQLASGSTAARRGWAVRDALRRSDAALACAVGVLTLLVVLSVTAPLWWSKGATTIDPVNLLAKPSWQHPMGTDDVGRDVFARFWGGARISLLVGLGVAVGGGVVGSALGLVSGLRAGIVSTGVQRLFDTLVAFPSLILAMAVTLGLGVGLIPSCIGAALATVPVFGRTVRSDVLRVRNAGYVESARALGVPYSNIVRRHVLPHVMPTIVVQMAATFAFGILTVAALGFVGLGAQIPTPEWGAMITEGSQYVVAGQWWVGLFPGLGLLIATAATGVIADRVQVILDPRSAGGRTLL